MYVCKQMYNYMAHDSILCLQLKIGVVSVVLIKPYLKVESEE